MRRLMPWAFLVLALGVTCFFALPLLLTDEGDEQELGAGVSADGEADAVAAPSLVGAPGARPAAAGRRGGGLRIVGDVTDAKGEPLGGVRVVARSLPRGDGRKATIRQTIESLDAPSFPPIAGEATSTDDGTFELEVREFGSYRVAAILEPPLRGSTPHVSFREGGKPEATASLRLREGTTLEGRVLDANDHGVAAVLGSSAYHAYGWMCHLDPLRTDPSDGTFTIEALPPGPWRFTLTVPGRLQLTGLEVELPREGEWTIRLGDATGTIAGTVTERGGEAVSGAVVVVRTLAADEATTATSRATTAVDGSYRVDLVPVGAITRVQVLHEDFVAYDARRPLALWSGSAVEPGEEARLDLELVPGATVSGRVYDLATKAPLADVQVFVTGPEEPYAGNPQPAPTDAEGRFRVPGVAPGRYLLLARHDTHYLPALEQPRRRMVQREAIHRPSDVADLLPPTLALVVLEGTKAVERDVGMRRGLALRGRVLGPDDVPVAGADVSALNVGIRSAASRLGMRPPPADDLLAQSAADGSFSVQGLPPRDDWVFFARKSPFVTVPTGKTALASDVAPSSLTLRLERGATLVGTVLAADGTGLLANVSAYPDGAWRPGNSPAHAQSASDGSFELEGVPAGNVRLFAYSQGRGTARAKVEGLEAGEVREGVRLQVAAGVLVEGVLVDPEDDPVAKTHLTIARADGTDSVSTTTDTQGRFAFENAPEGEVRVDIHRFRNGFGTSESLGEPFESPASGLRFVVKPEAKAIVEGRVEGPDGQPVPLCRVVVTGKLSGPRQYGRAPSQARREEVVGGHFRREVVGAPPYQVAVSEARDADGRILNLTPAKAQVSAAGGDPVVIRLSEGIEVEGRVVDADGGGIADVHVSNRSGDAFTDAGGRFRLAGFTGKADKVVVQVPAGYVHHAPVPIGKGDTELVIELKSALSVAGVLLAVDGKPRPGATVNAQWKSAAGTHGRASAATDAEGRFEVQGVPHGASVDLIANVWSSGARPAPAIATDVPAGTQDVVLRLQAGVAIEGRVVDARGKPVAKGHLMAVKDGTGPGGSGARVQSDGTFRIAGLEPGTYTVSMYGRRGGPVPSPVEVQAPATGVRLEVPDALTISGKVVADVSVEGYGVLARGVGQSTMRQAHGVVAADGSFTVEGVGGAAYDLQIKKLGGEYYGRADAVAPGTTGLVVTLKKGLAIEGTLEDAGGTPVEKGWVYAQGERGWHEYVTVRGGAFRMTGLPPGRYELYTSLPQQQRVRVGEAEAGDTGLRLRLGAR